MPQDQNKERRESMKIEIIYLMHSSFILKFDDKTLVFDIPCNVGSEVFDTVVEYAENTDIYIISSHGHGDHFNPEIKELEKRLPEAKFLLSFDIFEDFPEFKTENMEILDADTEYEIDDFNIKTYTANDRGIAFLINYKSRNFYFGGDLALWHWPKFNQEQLDEESDAFFGMTDILKEHKIHIAFSNTDPRLPNWAGGKEFIEEVKPEVFIPMHSFGQEERFKEFYPLVENLGSMIFKYEKFGNRFEIEI